MFCNKTVKDYLLYSRQTDIIILFKGNKIDTSSIKIDFKFNFDGQHNKIYFNSQNNVETDALNFKALIIDFKIKFHLKTSSFFI